MSNFTPGPWEPRKRYYADFDLPHWEVAYGDMEAHRLVAGYVRTEADARLIAAAPEMKDRLKEAKECLIYLTPWWEDDLERIEGVIDSINALLRRIEGKEDPK